MGGVVGGLVGWVGGRAGMAVRRSGGWVGGLVGGTKLIDILPPEGDLAQKLLIFCPRRAT